MKYRCPIPEALKDHAAGLVEFANGGAQATIELADGRRFENALISSGLAVAAVRGYDNPPFRSEEIARIYQTDSDKNPTQRGGWKFWDEWH